MLTADYWLSLTRLLDHTRYKVFKTPFQGIKTMHAWFNSGNLWSVVLDNQLSMPIHINTQSPSPSICSFICNCQLVCQCRGTNRKHLHVCKNWKLTIKVRHNYVYKLMLTSGNHINGIKCVFGSVNNYIYSSKVTTYMFTPRRMRARGKAICLSVCCRCCRHENRQMSRCRHLSEL